MHTIQDLINLAGELWLKGKLSLRREWSGRSFWQMLPSMGKRPKRCMDCRTHQPDVYLANWFHVAMRLFCNRVLKCRRLWWQRKRDFYNEFACFPPLTPYSSSLKMSNEGEFPRSWFLGNFKFRKIRRRLFTSPLKRAIRHFHVAVV